MSQKIKPGTIVQRKKGDNEMWRYCGGDDAMRAVRAVNNKGRLLFDGVEGTWEPAFFSVVDAPGVFS